MSESDNTNNNDNNNNSGSGINTLESKSAESSSLSSSTVPSHVLYRGDIEYVNSQLEYHYLSLRGEINKRLLNAEYRQQQEYNRMNEYNNSAENTINELKAQVESLKNELTKQKEYVVKTAETNTIMSNSWIKKSQQVNTRRMLSQFFGVWKQQYTHIQVTKEKTKKYIAPWANKKSLTRIFTSWRSVARESRKVADELFWRNEMKKLSDQLLNEYEKNLSELRAQLASAHTVINYHKQDQIQMEEKLKQAFIRGVCALNREALAVFNKEELIEAKTKHAQDEFKFNLDNNNNNNPPGPPPTQPPGSSGPAPTQQSSNNNNVSGGVSSFPVQPTVHFQSMPQSKSVVHQSIAQPVVKPVIKSQPSQAIKSFSQSQSSVSSNKPTRVNNTNNITMSSGSSVSFITPNTTLSSNNSNLSNTLTSLDEPLPRVNVPQPLAQSQGNRRK